MVSKRQGASMNFLGKEIGKNKYPCIIAEISCNHEGSLTHAKELIAAAKEANADAVKFQLYDADDMTYCGKWFNYSDNTNDFFIKAGKWKGQHLHTLYQKTGTPYEWVQVLFEYAKGVNIPLFASVFSERGIKTLEENNCPAYKIASFELNDTNLIAKAAMTSKPLVLSTGMATDREIENALLRTYQGLTPILLHCISAYPTRLEEARLYRIQQMRKRFSCLVGFSDHTEGYLAAQIACGMGACMIEKHLYLGGATSEDATFSLTPSAFKFFVKACRRAAESSFETISMEEGYSKQFRRSLYVVKDISKGEIFTPDNIRSIRPSYGLSPSMYNNVIGLRATMEIKAGTGLKEEHLK